MTKEEIIESMTNDEVAIVTIGVLDKGEKEFYSYGYKAEELDPKNYYYEIGSISKTLQPALIIPLATIFLSLKSMTILALEN